MTTNDKAHIDQIAGKLLAEGCTANSSLDELLAAVQNTVCPEYCSGMVTRFESAVRDSMR